MRIIDPSYKIESLSAASEILQNIERAARTCYKSENRITADSAKKFVGDLLSNDPPRLSVIEHEHMTVRLVCDRGVSHELVRHRLVSYSQESTRYCNYGKGKYGNEITVIAPYFFVGVDYTEEYALWKNSCKYAEGAYLSLLEGGAKPELARSVLPNSLKTEIVTTANLRQWGHIFYQRTSPKAHPQMRQLMLPLLGEVKCRVPLVFDDLSVYR